MDHRPLVGGQLRLCEQAGIEKVLCCNVVLCWDCLTLFLLLQWFAHCCIKLLLQLLSLLLLYRSADGWCSGLSLLLLYRSAAGCCSGLSLLLLYRSVAGCCSGLSLLLLYRSAAGCCSGLSLLSLSTVVICCCVIRFSEFLGARG
ncbi:hypothetical protein Bpfe_000404 [Biomphalaria pfeifferi]|uniref:Transmembrane protein n=1 Tax=Biomphalaria pfeifferi TaxID=112525 RepID=A0AAD8CCD2_BIOPF|nr:hypothetical protein Bpfe_000404 [Biomphalaria pfeifferi]